ncbi:ATP-binding cassette domain-containing protein [Oscillospiraceae bacterium CM]|nr:ATP-binding cassette domain-containing protein [Oscillospiraceae bacterium CM]
MTNPIEVSDLKKSFHVGGKEIRAVQGVFLTVRDQEIFGFLGPNGAGKSTTLRMLTTLLPIDGGSARVCGFDLKTQQNNVRQSIGYVSQSGGADLPATGRENLILAARLYGMRRSAASARADELLSLFDLTALSGRIVRTYSGGQRRRLEVALAMVNKPSVLFLDEPTTGLDLQNRANLWDQIRLLREHGTTVFLTTHYLEEADALCDRLCIIDDGRIVAEGTPQDLKRSISGDVVRLKLNDGKRVDLSLFRALPHVKDLRSEGDVITLYTDAGPALMQALFPVLEKINRTAESISLTQASLDDVFLKKTGRCLRDAETEVPCETHD